MSDKKRKIVETKTPVKTYENLFVAAETESLHIPAPKIRMEDMLQELFQKFRLVRVQVNYNDLENMLKERNATNFIVADFEKVDTPYKLIIEYSTSGDGGFHESSCAACVKICREKTTLKTFNIEMRNRYAPDQNRQCNSSADIPFLSAPMQVELFKHMPMLISRFSMLIADVIGVKCDLESTEFEKQVKYCAQNYNSRGQYTGDNPHGVKMEVLRLIQNFVHGFVKSNILNEN